MSPSLKSILYRFSFIALAALAVTIFMGKSYEGSLQALDSTTHAILALDMTANGLKPILPIPNFVTNKRPDLTFNDHPFALFYLSGQAMNFFGPDAWSARLVPTLFSVGCVLLLAWFGSLLYSPAVGLIAGLILMLSRDFIIIGTRFHLDTAMIFFILLSFIAWWKKRYVLTGVAAGLGMWMKTPVALLIFPSALFALMLTRQLDRKQFLNLLKGGVVALLVASVIWIITGFLGGWNLVVDYWTRQVWGTAVGGRGSPANTTFFMGMGLLRRNYIPWLILLMISLVMIIVKKRWQKLEVALPLVAALIVELVVSSMRFKFYWYFIPIFPFLALVCVDPLRNWLEKRYLGVTSFMIGAGLFVPALLVATPISLGPENFPALRRFHPIIQNYGTVQDRILFVDGEQPWGGDLDSMYELSFYTSRKILQGNCEESRRLLDAEKPEWVVVSGKNFHDCFSVDQLKQYPVQYKFGRQHLLSKIIPEKDALDLTPLARELKPLRKGVVAEYPRDPYFPNE